MARSLSFQAFKMPASIVPKNQLLKAVPILLTKNILISYEPSRIHPTISADSRLKGNPTRVSQQDNRQHHYADGISKKGGGEMITFLIGVAVGFIIALFNFIFLAFYERKDKQDNKL